MQKSEIDYCTHGWNFIGGCTPVSEGCVNCFAARQASTRLKNHPMYKDLTKNGRWTGEIRLCPERIKPIGGKPKRVFVQPMGDLFHEKVPFDFIDNVFGSMFAAAQHTYLILTKQSKRMGQYIEHLDEMCFEAGDPVCWSEKPNPNIWLGVSVENNKYIHRINELLKIPAAVRFVSHEPALGPITYPKEFLTLGNRAWLITGGESGNRARPMHPDWARHDRDQCKAAGVPFFFKQWGEWFPAYPQYSDDPNYDIAEASAEWIDGMDCVCMEPSGSRPQGYIDRQEWCYYQPSWGAWWIYRIGKKKAGRLLDGRFWNQSPLQSGGKIGM